MKLIPILFTALIATTALISHSTYASSPKSATSATKPKAAGVWIDVRSSSEYSAGHLQGAHNITHTDIVNKITRVAPNKSTPVHVYCRSGSRAEAARKTLLAMGYTNVTNHGGYEDLKQQGYR